LFTLKGYCHQKLVYKWERFLKMSLRLKAYYFFKEVMQCSQASFSKLIDDKNTVKGKNKEGNESRILVSPDSQGSLRRRRYRSTVYSTVIELGTVYSTVLSLNLVQYTVQYCN
jgi:hypothetical protein